MDAEKGKGRLGEVMEKGLVLVCLYQRKQGEVCGRDTRPEFTLSPRHGHLFLYSVPSSLPPFLPPSLPLSMSACLLLSSSSYLAPSSPHRFARLPPFDLLLFSAPFCPFSLSNYPQNISKIENMFM